MLPQVKTKPQKLERYKNVISEKLFQEINGLAKKLQGLRVVHINATPRGGGVAEILKSLVPLMRGVGIKTQWYVIPPGRRFFGLTKQLHNALQGKDFTLSSSSRKLYQHYMKRSAKLMEDIKADLLIVHDPQPLGVADYLARLDFRSLIARIHIDTSNPNPEAWDFIKKFLLQYDKIIFSARDFIHPDIPRGKRVIFSPAIDPLTEKNQPFPVSQAKTVLEGFGIKPDRPLIVQVSRFDPWKDPIGVIEAYRIAKKKIPNLQLALVGLFLAQDDPEAIKVFRKVKKETKGDNHIFLFSDPDQLGSLKVDRFVNACQTAADVVLQKSIKEGFGLTVTEAMWKRKAVIGGNVGGIKLQIKDGKNGFLVSNSREAAQRIVELMQNSKLREKLGKSARKTVKEKFLIHRLLRDYLRLFTKLV